LAVSNFVATSNQWKSWHTARILCFNKNFKRNCTISTGISDWGVWCKKVIRLNFRSRESDKKIWLRHWLWLLVWLAIRLHPKTSDSLRLRHRLRNPCNSCEADNVAQSPRLARR